MLVLMAVQLTGLNCVGADDIPFSPDPEKSIAIAHCTEEPSIDDATAHHTDDGAKFHACPCHFQFIHTPLVASVDSHIELMQPVLRGSHFLRLLSQNISKPPRLG